MLQPFRRSLWGPCWSLASASQSHGYVLISERSTDGTAPKSHGSNDVNATPPPACALILRILADTQHEYCASVLTMRLIPFDTLPSPLTDTAGDLVTSYPVELSQALVFSRSRRSSLIWSRSVAAFSKARLSAARRIWRSRSLMVWASSTRERSLVRRKPIS